MMLGFRNIPQSTAAKVVLTLMLIFVYYLIFLPKAGLTDTAYFGGDTWGYQSRGVNFAKGHGITTFGEYESFEIYKFAIPKETGQDSIYQELRQIFLDKRRPTDVYRTPGYSLFLGSVYKIFGVSPLIAKKMQLLLLVIIAACLPWIGMYYFKRLGFLSGLIASPIAIASMYLFSTRILTESLLTFSLFVIITAFAWFEAKKNIFRAAVLGFSIAISLLVKPAFLVLAALLLLHLFSTFVRTRKNIHLYHVVVIVAVAAATIAPWSYYVSEKKNSFVALSPQINGGIWLQSHNEYVTDGMYHPEYKENEESFYNNDGSTGASPILRVANFYKQHPELLTAIASAKLTEGLKWFPFLRVILTFFIVESVLMFFLRGRRWVLQVPPLFLFVFINMVLITVILHVSHSPPYPSRFVKPMDFLFILTGVHALLSGILHLHVWYRSHSSAR